MLVNLERADQNIILVTQDDSIFSARKSSTGRPGKPHLHLFP